MFDKCPGTANIRTPTIKIKECPECGEDVEIFSNEMKVNCGNCGFTIYNDLQSCVQWCEYAKECVSEELYKKLKEDSTNVVKVWKRKVLFLCTTNSCRSQMAEGILRHLYGAQFEVYSAGAKPSSVHPLAIRVMAEIGIDISKQMSKSVEEFSWQEFDYVITLCGDYAKDECPLFVGKAKERLHWNFLDPAEAEGDEEQKIEVFRKVRDEIRAKIEQFVKENKWR